MAKIVTPEQIQREIAETEKLPIAQLLPKLFADPKMFDSFKSFSRVGFSLIDHSPTKILSGSHKSAPGYLFKKYSNDKDKKQILNYMRRIEGARLLRSFIAEQHFQHVRVPGKWLWELPPSFPERYLVIAEKVDLASDDKSKSNYSRIDKGQMRELATILFHFRGLNSTTSNLPYAKDGKIAFIDTERWHHDKDYLRKVGDRISSDRRKLAMDVYKELSGQRKQPFQSQFK